MNPFTVTSIQHWPLERLTPYVGNARTHSAEQVEQLARSITEFGFTNPILVGADGVIVAGHARLLAARHLSMADVPVIVLDHLNATQRRALVLADNQLAITAGWDEAMLRQELEALAAEEYPLSLTGFNDEELTEWMQAIDLDGASRDEDEIPPVITNAISVRGDLWMLGDHQLLCGDALSAVAVDRVMRDCQAQLIVTDPPYNVDYHSNTKEHLAIAGDAQEPEQFKEFLAQAFRNYRRIVHPTASLYVWHASTRQWEFQQAIEAAGFKIRSQIVWVKHTFAFGFARYKYRHEPIFYGHVAGKADLWYGDASQCTVWEENKPWGNREHPTAKPVALIERALRNSSRPGDVVVDLFGGSGSTLIACEQQKRVCRTMEIDPLYCDVIIRRWQQHTGLTAYLEGDGRSFDKVSSAREQEPLAV